MKRYHDIGGKAMLCVLAFVALGCETDPFADCEPSITIDGVEGTSVDIVGNERRTFDAKLDLCTDDSTQLLGYQYEWRYDSDGNGVIDDVEQEPLSFSPSFELIVCPDDAGTHALSVKAIPITDDTQPEFEVDLSINVSRPTERISRPDAVVSAMTAIQTLEEVVEPAQYAPFVGHAKALQEYTASNVCDLQANYASSIATLIKFSSTFQDRFVNRSSLSIQDINDIYTEEITPLLDRMLVVEQKATASFTFPIGGRARIKVFGDIPYLDGDESVYVTLFGDNDLSDVHAFAAVAHVLKGGYEMFLAYEGLPKFFLDIPRLDNIDYLYFRQEAIKRLEADPEFFTLAGDDGQEGANRLLRARGEFMDSLISIRAAVEALVQETDPQSDDLLRYWDCGIDGKCDCSLTENGVLVNSFIACPTDPKDYPGPDEGEGDGKYTPGELGNENSPGEPIGSDRLENPEPQAQNIGGGNLEEFKTNTLIILENLRGPDALDLNDFVPGAVLGLQVARIPVPEIRLSEWFLTPTNLRQVFPLYSISAGDILFDLEVEPFKDTGYDGKLNADETTPEGLPEDGGKNIRGLPAGQLGFDSLKNPDPFWDDFDPFCNPYCNWEDGIDNDGDGAADDDDFGQFDIVSDLGVESNFVFDFVDLDGDRIHNENEVSEPFTDEGVVDLSGNVVGAGNNVWDRSDRAHEWPTGPDIGPVQVQQTDPANGVREDEVSRLTFDFGSGDVTYAVEKEGLAAVYEYDGLIDNYYLFFPDAEFSGVLKFPEEIESIGGGELTENAKLMRFFNKILEFAEVVNVREGNAHVCRNANKCLRK